MECLLDELLPVWNQCEMYGRRVTAPPERALEAMQSVELDEIHLLRTLLVIRSLPGLVVRRPRFGDMPRSGLPLLERMFDFGVLDLGREGGTEIAFGLIDQSWKVSGGERAPVRTREEFTAFAEPGFVKVAANLAARPAPGGSFLTTQTRVLATDERSRRLFAAYWLFIRPFSGLTRRNWLAAAARRVEP